MVEHAQFKFLFSLTLEKSSLKASQICTIFPSSAASLVLKKCYQFLDFRNHRDLDVFEDYGDGRLEKVHWATILHYYNEIIGYGCTHYKNLVST